MPPFCLTDFALDFAADTFGPTLTFAFGAGLGLGEVFGPTDSSVAGLAFVSLSCFSLSASSGVFLDFFGCFAGCFPCGGWFSAGSVKSERLAVSPLFLVLALVLESETTAGEAIPLFVLPTGVPPNSATCLFKSFLLIST